MRNTLLQWGFEKIQERARKKNVSLTVSEIDFKGLKTISINNLSVKPDSSDTLLVIKKADVTISWLTFLKLEPVINKLDADSVILTIYRLQNRNNIAFLNSHKTDTTQINTANGYNHKISGIANRVFKLLDVATTINNLYLSYADSTYNQTIIVPSFVYDLKQLQTCALLKTQNKFDTLFVSAQVEKEGKVYHYNISHPAGGKTYLPILKQEKFPKLGFKSISGKLTYNYLNDIELGIDAQIADLHINHWRLSESDVVMPQTQFIGTIKIGVQNLSIDSTSVLKLNNAQAMLYANFSKAEKNSYAFKITMEPTQADTFFKALPLGMFNTLRGIKTKGTLSFNLNFELNGSKPDDVKFEASLQKKNFSIINFGAEYYGRINQTFLFDALDGDRLVRQLTVGPESNTFTPFADISSYLKYAVLTSEDGSFMYHHGFNEDAFRQSIATNYKQGRFARGGSTITMQLVKNCFLSRDKTVSRKAEEALIVWLIENCGLVSKERMLEVYLNVIEWGPDVYGIGEAAGFYFAKQPKDLTLAESIFLASIIPHPKYFKYSFSQDATLKPFLTSYYKLLSNKMLGRNWITDADTVGLTANVILTGPAKNFVLQATDSLPMPADSILQQDLQIVD